MCSVANTQSFSLQRLGLHPGHQRQGGCRRLALGIEGKVTIILLLHMNMHTMTDQEPLLQGLIGRPVMDLVSEGSVLAQALGGDKHGPEGDLGPDIVGK